MRHVLFAVYAVICLGAITWPGYASFGNSIEPFILGVPFSLAWVVGWVVLTFIVLLAYHATGEPGESDAKGD